MILNDQYPIRHGAKVHRGAVVVFLYHAAR
jgi:hypothetical protein